MTESNESAQSQENKVPAAETATEPTLGQIVSKMTTTAPNKYLLLLVAVLAATPFLLAVCRPYFTVVDFDAYNYYLTWKMYSVKGLSDPGAWLWNPYIDGGRPVLADPVTQTLYPGQIFFFVLSPVLAWKAFVCAHLLLCFANAIVFLRVTKHSWSASIAASAILCLSGPLLSHHWSPIWFCGLAWLPLAMAAGHKLLKTPNTDSATIWQFSIFFAIVMIILAGAIEPFFALVYYLLWYGLVLGFWPEDPKYYFWRRDCWTLAASRLKVMAIPALLTVMASALLWLPAFELLSESGRSSGLDPVDPSKWNFVLGRFCEFFAPSCFGSHASGNWNLGFVTGNWSVQTPFVGSVYCGSAALIFAVVGWLNSDRQMRLFSAIGLITLIFLSFGINSPVYPIVRRIMPGFSLFRYCEKLITIVPFFLAPLVATGIDKFFQKRIPVLLWRALIVIPVLFALLLLSLLTLPELLNSKISQDVLNQFIWQSLRGLTPYVLTLGALAYWRRKPKTQSTTKQAMSMKTLLVVLVVLDVGLAAPAVVTTRPARAELEQPALWPTAKPTKFGPPRILVRDVIKLSILPQHAEQHGFSSMQGYGSARIKTRDQFDFAFSSFEGDARLQMSGVHYQTIPRAPKGGYDPSQVLFLPFKSTGRICWVTELETASSQDYAFKKFPPKIANSQSGAIAYIPEQFRAKVNERGAGTIELLASSHNQLKLKINCEKPGWLLVRDTFFPGWKASLNGTATEMFRANLCFRLVYIPKGEQLLVMSYQPNSVLIALGLFLLSCPGALYLLYRALNSMKKLEGLATH